MPLHLLAAGTRLEGELDDALELYEESLELNRGRGDSIMVAMELHNLGHVEVRRGNLDAARRHFAECALLRSGQNPYDVAKGDLDAAALAVVEGDRAAVLELLTGAEQTLAEAGIVLDADDQSEVDWLREQL
jgi:tetratricopeptide (TPR) repeat protein